MPAINAADLARLRQLKQWSQIYMAVHKPETMFTGTVNDPDIERKAREIPFTGGVMAGYTPLTFFDEHATLWVGTNPGERDEGIVRVIDVSGTWPHHVGEIEVAENADIHWKSGLHLTIKDEHRLWPRFPRVELDKSTTPVTITWWKDYDIAYAGQTSYNDPPVVVMGPPACAFRDSVTGLATVNFWADDSYLGRVAGVATFLWTFPHGTPGNAVTEGTEAVPHTVTWDTPGVYMVRFRIITALGGTSYGYRPIFIFDRAGDNAPYQDFEILNMRGSFNSGGWIATIRVFGECDVEDFPEGSQVVIFAEDWYGGEKVSIGGYGHRENIVLVGWIIADSVQQEPTTGEVTFQLHTIDGELRNCPGFPISIERVMTTPTNWNEIEDMHLDQAGFYVGYWHSTLYEIADVLRSNDTRNVKYLDIPQNNLYNQLDRGVFAETIFGRALSDRQSRFKYDVNPQYLVASERDALDTIISIQPDDWLGKIDVDELQEKQVSWVDVSGVRVSSWENVYPVFAIAPGDVPSPDGSFKQLGRLVFEDQEDANRQAAFVFAHLNKMHPGRTTNLARVRVPFQGNYRVFDIQPQEWVEFPSIETLREGRGPGIEDGTPWPTGTRFIPRDIDISFQNAFGNFMVTTDLEPECSGTYSEPVTFPGQLGSGGKVAIVQQTTANLNGTGTDIETVFISENLFATSPTWAHRHNGLPWYPLAQNFEINAFKVLPPYTGKNNVPIVALIGVDTQSKTFQGIYRNADLRVDTAWVATLTDAMVLAQAYAGAGIINDWQVRDIEFDSTTPGWAIAFVWVDHSVAVDKIHAFRTIDYGITWTHLADISLQLGGGTNDFIWPESAAIVDPYDPNYLYLKLRRGAVNWYWARSTDKGVTWTPRMGGPGTNTINLYPGQGSDDAYYDPVGSGWSLTFLSQMGEDIVGNDFSFGIRYPNPGIPQGTTINNAIAKIKAFPTGQLGGAITVRIRGILEKWLPTFTTRGAWNSWARTVASVNWNPPNFVPGTTYNTPNLSAIIQELVNQAGWTPDCAIALDFELTASAFGRMRVAYNYENSPSETPILEINYNCAALTEPPSRPVALNPHYDRESLGSFFRAINPSTAYKTVDGWSTRYIWFQGGGTDSPVSDVVPLGAHGPIVYLTSVEGTSPVYVSYLHTSQDGENFGAGILLPCAIAQSFNVWPWMIEGETLMYMGNRTGDSVGAAVDYAPLEFWISQSTGAVGTWEDKTGNLNALLDALVVGRDRLTRIVPLDT